MRTRIVKIGNSRGVRIPKLLLERSKLAEEVELEAEDNRIIIRSIKHPRQDWQKAFSAMAEKGDDALLDGDSPLKRGGMRMSGGGSQTLRGAPRQP